MKASYDFWAPWIGPRTRRNDVVFNTEYRKCHQITLQDVSDTSNLPGYSEEDLLDMMNFAQVVLHRKKKFHIILSSVFKSTIRLTNLLDWLTYASQVFNCQLLQLE